MVDMLIRYIHYHMETLIKLCKTLKQKKEYKLFGNQKFSIFSLKFGEFVAKRHVTILSLHCDLNQNLGSQFVTLIMITITIM